MAEALASLGSWVLGQVSRYHPETHTYTVTSVKPAGRIFQGVPRLLDHPGDVSGLAPNTLVAMHRELGDWVIAGILNQRASGQPETAPVRVTEVAGFGADDPTAPPATGDARARNAPTDISVEDWARHGDRGQLVALLRGGAAVLRASPLSQVRLFQNEDLVQVVSHLFKHITAMGESEVKADNGRYVFTWRAGANQDDVGGGRENWTLRLEVGATGTGHIFSFSVTTPEGQVLSRIAMTPEGRLELRGNSVEVTAGSAGTAAEAFGGDRSVVVEGSVTERVTANRQTTIGGVRKTSVAQDDVQTVGALKQTVTGAHHAFVGTISRRKVLGDMTAPVPGARAEVVEYVNGGVEVVIGNPVSLGVPAAQQGANWVSYVGGFNFVLQPSSLPAPIGGFNVMSALPSSVNLGCDGVAIPDPTTGGHRIVPVPASFGVMKWEPWMTLMQILLTWLETHVHPTSGGPSGPPAAPLTPMMTPLMPLVRSVRVGVGL